MNSKFLLSLESIPRSSGFLCLSLKFGCILSSLVYIVYSLLGLAVCVAAWGDLDHSPDRIFAVTNIVLDTICHVITFLLSFVLLLGLLKDKAKLMRPWILWTTFQTLAYVSFFIFSSAVQLFNHAQFSILVYLAQFLVLVLRMYMIVLVASYYKDLKEMDEDEEKFRQLMSKENWYTAI